MSTRRGPPKHQNRYAWKPNGGRKINETELGGKLKPLSEITGVCPRCREQIDWKRRYGKYKPLTEPAKCQLCSKRNVRQAYHNLCTGCAKEQKVCAKCRCRVDQIVGRDSADVEEEQKMLAEAIKNARERNRRTLLRAMDKSKPKGSSKTTANKENGRVGEIFPSTSLEEYAKLGRKDYRNHEGCSGPGTDDIDNCNDDENDSEEHNENDSEDHDEDDSEDNDENEDVEDDEEDEEPRV